LVVSCCSCVLSYNLRHLELVKGPSRNDERKGMYSWSLSEIHHPHLSSSPLVRRMVLKTAMRHPKSIASHVMASTYLYRQVPTLISGQFKHTVCNKSTSLYNPIERGVVLCFRKHHGHRMSRTVTRYRWRELQAILQVENTANYKSVLTVSAAILSVWCREWPYISTSINRLRPIFICMVCQ